MRICLLAAEYTKRDPLCQCDFDWPVELIERAGSLYKEQGCISRAALPEIAFYASRDTVNMATDPTSPNTKKILELLIEMCQ